MNARSILVALACAVAACRSAERHAAPLVWKEWGPAAFDEARAEHKLLLLDLHAVWCHWCHVMDETTYRDERVRGLLNEHFVLLGVDQDARPDLSNRYEDWGWPATILFAADGTELVKRAGYIPPDEMVALLEAVIADPTPGPSAQRERPAPTPARARTAGLSAEERARLETREHARYDEQHAGFGSSHKYLDAASYELLIREALAGVEGASARAVATLDATRALIDPVWGGIYQYSVGGDWKEPHFEKLASFQADALRIYSLAYAMDGDVRWSESARDVRRYVERFLTRQEGTFCVSQDADLVPGEHSAEYFALDDAGRRARGIPRVDTHVYARENGWLIRGLCAFHDVALADAEALASARKAAQWVLAQRALPGGGFRHDERDAAGPYLGDSLAMAQAFLALYESTAERSWLAQAVASSEFIARNFALAAGFASAVPEKSALGLPPQAPQRDENVGMCRLENALFQYTGAEIHRERAALALHWLASDDVASKGPPAGVLLCAAEFGAEPTHVTVVGKKSDPAARTLFEAALALPLPYRRIEWLDTAEGTLPRGDVEYPELDQAAAFTCSAGRCSPPAFDGVALRKRALRTP